jgi:hypothetical protein
VPASDTVKPNAIEAKIGLTLVLYVAQRWKPLEAACKQVLKEDPQHGTVRARLAASPDNPNAIQGMSAK